MKFFQTSFRGLYYIESEPFIDERGLFARTYCKNEFAEIGHNKEFVQSNLSITRKKGTIRGMHYQMTPFTEVKLIRCIRGRVFDVVIDIREDSPTFLNYFSLELNETNMISLYVPEGFAHGFQTLTDNAQMIYHHTAYYKKGSEAAIRYNDNAIGIKWPLPVSLISEKDLSHKLLDKDFVGLKL